MKFYRSEIAFLIFLSLLVGAAAFSYQAHDAVLSQMSARQGAAAGLDSGLFAVRASLTLIAIGLLAGFFYFYPLIREQARERGELREMTVSLSEKSATFQQAALTDPLTGLQNRRYFDDALAQYMEEFARIERPLGIMIIDIDHFKSINDTHGHDVGDEVIKSLAKTVLEYTRYHDIAARIGGEEFAVVAPNLSMDELNRLANRLRLAVAELAMKIGNVRLRITVSIGVAIWDGKETTAKLYKRADSNLYQAKRGGRNRVCA
ncbi:GGDEF domain-containing protein [Oricola cellulosilytica]|uniref:diguanylate cyclase n=1 Tax=Oricola cellulosilytica TaxID=1429082 RepID=A0A4R0PEK0_9HYPH|nr:GGDEF domain-containing protein [Oricola cellulosilytica]TCD15193.1 GGDEF domain-containing protein [Oricola cellulosilytica]